MQGDSFTVRSGREALLDVLANDQAGTTKLPRSSLQIVSGPNHAVSYSVRKRQVEYRSVEGYSGPDSFDYQVCNTDGLCATARVTISVA